MVSHKTCILILVVAIVYNGTTQQSYSSIYLGSNYYQMFLIEHQGICQGVFDMGFARQCCYKNATKHKKLS